MSDSRDLGRLGDEGVRDLLARLIDSPTHFKCPDCGRAVVSTELPAGSTACPHCGAALADDTATNASLDSLDSLEVRERRRPAQQGQESAAGVSADDFGATRSWNTPADSTVAPQRIGPYEILRLLGTGGFGRVALARDVRTGREVALKTLRREKFPDEESYRSFVERFLEEGRRTAELRHPAIVEVYEVGTAPETGDPYIAMEYVDGGTLEERMAREPRPSRGEAVRIVIAVANALELAHSRRIYHCDLKPSNILLTRRGRVKVADFGLSLHEDEQWEHEGQVAGTFPYMSPEQFDGRRHHLDGRTDIWSLGVILYELIAGRRPFTGDRRQLREAVLHRDPVPLAQRDPTAPAVYDRVVSRALHKRPEGRYSSAGEFSRALRYSTWRENRRGFLAAAALSSTACGAFGFYSTRPTVDTPLEVRSAPNSWFDLLEDGASKKLYWPGDATTSVEHTDRKRAIHLKSGPIALLQLGLTHQQSWMLEFTVKYKALIGSVGVFFGYRSVEAPPESDDTTDYCYRFQTISLDSDGLMSSPHYVTSRRIIQIYRQNGFENYQTVERQLSEPFSDVTNHGEARFVVRLNAGFVTEIFFDGSQSKMARPSTTDRYMLDRTWPASTGMLGVFSKNVVAEFNVCRFLYSSNGDV